MQKPWVVTVVSLFLLATSALAAQPPTTVTFNLTGVGSGNVLRLSACPLKVSDPLPFID